MKDKKSSAKSLLCLATSAEFSVFFQVTRKQNSVTFSPMQLSYMTFMAAELQPITVSPWDWDGVQVPRHFIFQVLSPPSSACVAFIANRLQIVLMVTRRLAGLWSTVSHKHRQMTWKLSTYVLGHVMSWLTWPRTSNVQTQSSITLYSAVSNHQPRHENVKYTALAHII